MKFNYGSEGICQEARALLGLAITDTVSLSDAEVSRGANNWCRRVDNLIANSEGDWEYDDSNFSTFPIYTADLFASQADYSLKSEMRKVERVEVMNDSGDYMLLTPITKEMVKNGAMTEIYQDDGFPVYYDLIGGSVILYPTPGASHITTEDGLKIYVSRDIEEFNATTTTREPGFDKAFHKIVPLGISYDKAVSVGLESKANYLLSQLKEVNEEMKEFYSKRHAKNFRPHIYPKTESHI